MRIASVLAALSVASAAFPAVQTREADVCVYGGTSAGVVAAYTAKMHGKSVIVVEPGRHPGGMSTGGLGLTDIGNKYVVTGLARDFYRRVGEHYGKFEQWIFEPSVAEEIFNQYIDKAGIEMVYSRFIAGARTAGGKIEELSAVAVGDRSDTLNVRAKMFIDCSYEGDLMAKAGVTYTTGREDNSLYGETYNGVQLLQGHQFPDGVDPYVVPGKPESGLLWGVSPGELRPQGEGDKKIQAYNYRITLTDNPANRIPITRPADYDSTKYELLLRQKAIDPWKTLNDVFIWSKMPGGKTDINNRNGFSTDMVGMNWDYPEADFDRRQEIIAAHESYTKGLLYFVGNDSRVPGFIRDEMKRWGYPKDEYTDNGNWSPQLYIREARRMVSDVVMTQRHCLGADTVADPIGMAAYTMDSHNCQRIVVDGMVKNEGNVEIGGFPPYPISYRSIVPKRGEASNLLVPVCLSASHIAYGSIRMEPVFMVLAQAAGMAACEAIDEGLAVQDIDAAKLAGELRADPLADGSFPEILVDNLDSQRILATGDWQPYNDPYRAYGPDFKVADARGGEPFSMKFMTGLDRRMEMDVYAYIPLIDDATTRMDVAIFDGENTAVSTVDVKGMVVEGQTFGEWISLGRFVLGKGSYAEITGRGADGIVAADALLFVPAK